MMLAINDTIEHEILFSTEHSEGPLPTMILQDNIRIAHLNPLG